LRPEIESEVRDQETVNRGQNSGLSN